MVWMKRNHEGRGEDSVVTLPFLLWTLRGMLGDVSRSRDSCSDSFFLSRSITLEPLLALWNWEKHQTVAQTRCFLCKTRNLLTFSLWISLRRCDIFTLMASSSSSGTCGTVSGSASSRLWKLSSVKGMYHLQSYCWFFLQDQE